MNSLTSQSFSASDASATSRFYDAIHIHYEKVGVFSEQAPEITSFGLLRDRIAATGVGEKIQGWAEKLPEEEVTESSGQVTEVTLW